MSRLQITDTPIAGLKLVQRQTLADPRGFLSRLFCRSGLLAAGWMEPIAQVNHTLTVQQGTVRGLHYQKPPHAEMKLVSCLRGQVWDVAVDLRSGSPTYLCWYAAQLSAQNGHALLIPRGCAHGFQALCSDVELLYCHSTAYAPDAEAGLDALDARLGISWPLPVSVRSGRDAGFAAIGPEFPGVQL